MFLTKHGWFDGNNWDSFCQICFKLKFLEDGYQQVKASPGDYGIEGFTRSGKAFQCYCPDHNYGADELYKKQRDKITKDLGKLLTYKNQLKDLLGGVKIKTWYFVTPESHKKDLIQHCSEKAIEYRAMVHDHLDLSFDVLLFDLDYFAAEIPIALSQSRKKLELSCKEDVLTQEIELWKSNQSALVANAIRKHRARFENVPSNVEDVVQKLTTITVKEFLEGTEKLRSWEELQQERYERYQKLLDSLVNHVEQKCLFSKDDNNSIIEQIRAEIRERLDREFPELDSISLDSLADFAISKWILDCTLDIR